MYTIRPMTLDDYEAVYDLWLHTPGMELNTTDDSREGVARFLRRNPTTCLVAEDAGQLVGVALAGHDGRRGYLYHTAVREDARHQGIGHAMIERLLTALEAEGIQKVGLLAFAHNEGGNRFWKNFGFEARGDLIYRCKALREIQTIMT